MTGQEKERENTQEVIPVNTKAKDMFFKKVYESEKRQRELVSFLLGVNIEKVSQNNIRPILFGTKENDFSCICDNIFFTLSECQASVSLNVPYRLVEYAVTGLRSMVDSSQLLYSSKRVQFLIPKLYVLQVGLEAKNERLPAKVQYDLQLSESYVSAEEKYGENAPKPDLDATVHVYDFRMTLNEVLTYIESNTLPKRFNEYKNDMLNYALVANGITYMQRVHNGIIQAAPKNVSSVVEYLQLLQNRGIFMDLLSDKEVCDMTIAQFSRDEELRYHGWEEGWDEGWDEGREEERKNTQAAIISGIKNIIEVYHNFNQPQDIAKNIVINKYPDTDTTIIDSIIAEIYNACDTTIL